jgi:hypothetical protein
MEFIKTRFENLCSQKSDINEHLQIIYEHAKKCESIIELGVRGCVSSWAFIYGLLNNNSNIKKILLNDLHSCDINELLYTTKDLDIEVKYEWKNDLDLVIKENVDLVFIDTWHVYGQLKRELNKFSVITNKYIIMHDTTIDEIYGELIRCGGDAIKESNITGIPVEEINCGLQKAIDEFLLTNTEWKLKKKYINNNGLTILARK